MEKVNVLKTLIVIRVVRNLAVRIDARKNPSYIMAEPRMQLYINYAAEIYGIYLRYFSADDIFVYSVDEAFIDVTGYLNMYHTTPRKLAVFLLRSIEKELGLPASCGIGTNLYLAKIALDITAKHAPDRIGELTESSFCETLWHHQPITDFWQIKKGTRCQQTILDLQDRFGKCSVFYARDLLQDATTLQRYNQIGGHKRGNDSNTHVQQRKNISTV